MIDLFYKPLLWTVLEKSISKLSETDEKGTTQELKEESFRQEIKSRAMQAQAKVEQELAIARRIDSAEEVEIEEYYDTSGKGTSGLQTDGSTASVGIGGEGRRVTKRIIKFKGCRPIIQVGSSANHS